MNSDNQSPASAGRAKRLSRMLPFGCWVLLVAAVVARIVHLDSDPKFEFWWGYVGDEGRWVETARNLALFGEPGLYGISQLHLMLSAGFQSVVFTIFKLFGVGFISARIWSAVCGSLIVIVTCFFWRKVVRGMPLLLGVAFLAFEPLVLDLSRTALPEVPSLLFTLLAFIAICVSRRPSAGAAAAGLLFAVAISMKGTVALLAPVFVVLVLLSGRTASIRGRLLDCAAFLFGLLTPVLIGLFVAVSAGIIKPISMLAIFSLLLKYISYGGFYSFLIRFFQESEVASVNLLFLGVWLGSWALLFRKECATTPLWRIFRLSSLWSVGWLLVWPTLSYTPDRYFVHLLMPLVINVAAGLALWQQLGSTRIIARIDALRLESGAMVDVWLLLPTAVLFAAFIASLASVAGVPVDRLSQRLLLIFTGAALLVWVSRTKWLDKPVAAALIAFPVMTALLCFAIGQLGMVVLGGPAATVWVPLSNIFLFIAVAVGLAAKSKIVAASGGSFTRWGTAMGVLTVGGLLCQDVPALLHPTYSIRMASRDIAVRFRDAQLMWSSSAGLLFLDTKLHYRDSVPPGMFADGILDCDTRVHPGAEFAHETTYRLIVHPNCCSDSRPRVEGHVALVEVYRNTQMPPHERN